MRRPAELHGILVVDKPAGWTSHDVVARVRRLAGQRAVGHGGTLDPSATGVLPLGLGRATRLLEYVSGSDKCYEASVRFGVATDTYDADGAVSLQAPWLQITRDRLEQALAGFTGEIQQRPPPYSAIKVAGQPLYKYARGGRPLALAARTVSVQTIELLRFDPPAADLRIDCGSGTYVRSIAHDLGLALGSAAHLTALRRTRAGGFTLADAVSLETLSNGGSEELAARLLALDRPVWKLPAVILAGAHADDVRHGRPLAAPPTAVGLCRAYDLDGAFLALLGYDAQQCRWRTHKVFAAGG